MKFAAIDVGSNAVRLLLSRVIETAGAPPLVKKEALMRIPLRLGEDAFVRGRISTDKTDRFISTMTGFRYLMDAYQPLEYMACATSAMREAENGQQIAMQVKEACGTGIANYYRGTGSGNNSCKSL